MAVNTFILKKGADLLDVPQSKNSFQGTAEAIIKGFGLQALKPILFQKLTVEEDLPLQGKSILGTPVYDRFEVKAGIYQKWDETKEIENDIVPLLNINYGRVKIDTILYEVSKQKNIITTAISGRNGTVKEYFGEDDYVITARGAIVSNDQRYPESEVLALKRILDIPDSFRILSPFLNNIFGIFEVIVTNYRFPQTEGMRNSQVFEVNMISHEPLEKQVAMYGLKGNTIIV